MREKSRMSERRKKRVAGAGGVRKMRRMETPLNSFVDSRDFARIAKAIRYIDANFRSQPKLAAVAAHVNLSEFHFNRLFRRWAGVTPKQYLAAVTGSAARAALAGQSSVLDAALTVGLSGPGRLHDLVVTLEAMTPGELKARGEGATVRYGFSNTPFGRAILAATARGLSHLAFVDVGEELRALAQLRATAPLATFERDDDEARALAMRIWSPKERSEAPLRLNVGGTNFQLKVWQALLELGARDRTSYSALADSIGASSSTRAVAGAVGANAVAWLIPCHHVLRKGGGLGGYRWGEDRKRAMLAWEGLASSSPGERVRESAHTAARAQ
jgi:AraC family transcriptional regulator, regulatory protein of adaptative response / methylated-DNA-[protein]-cysteine methyltransferase